MVAASPAAVEPTPFNTTLATVVGQLISRIHYTAQPFDQELSERLFDEYLRALDRERRFFLASDIAEFEDQRSRLHRQVRSGDLSFVYQVYDRYLERVRGRVEYVRQAVGQPLDFEVEEEIVVDRSEEPWPADIEELDEIWRRRVKNRLLLYKMMEDGDGRGADDEDSSPPSEEEPEPENERQAESGGDDTAPSEDGAETGQEMELLLDRRTPEERVVAYYERMLGQLDESESIDVLEIFLNALTRVYDPHSNYMAPAREEDFEIDMSLSLEGIGAVLTTEEGYVKIVEIIPGGPAERDGRLQVGDRIVAVSSQGEMVDVVNMSLRRVVRMIRGPKGTTVHLQVIEAGRGLGALPTMIDLERDKIQLTEQQVGGRRQTIELAPPTERAAEAGEEDLAAPGEEAASAEILIVSLPSFYADFAAMREGDEDYRRASRDLREILSEAVDREGGVDGLILDLRYNGGGSLDEAVEVAGLFLAGGPVVQVRSSGGQVQILRDEDQATAYDGPLLVLVNRLSASASEIVAAALQDHGRALVVGDRSTYGKGTVQHIYDLNRFFMHHPFFSGEQAGSIKFTMAKYYRVNGGSVQLKGVAPDISLPAFTDDMEVGEDNLEGALPWNQIDPLIEPEEVDSRWRRHLPVLQDNSRQRVAEDPDFREIVATSRRLREVREQKTRPLSLQARREVQRQEEEWFETIRRESARRRRRRGSEENGREEVRDPHLEEALRIIGELIQLDRQARTSQVAGLSMLSCARRADMPRRRNEGGSTASTAA